MPYMPVTALILSIMGTLFAALLLPMWNVSFIGQAHTSALLIIAGAAIPAIAIGSFWKADTTVLPHELDSMRSLVDSGIYSFTRNPMYLGMALVLTGIGVALGTPITLAITSLFVFVINRWQIRPEEQAMERIFGQQFADYKSRVRRWI